jgi:hypothetical protein
MNFVDFGSPAAIVGLAVLVIIIVGWMVRHRYRPIIPSIFFVRYQILVALALVLLAPVAQTRDASGIMGNLLVLQTAWQLFVVTLLGILLAWVVMFTLLLAWERRPDALRSDETNQPRPKQRPETTWQEELGPPLLRALGFAALALPLVGYVFFASRNVGWMERSVAMVAAMLVAVVLFILAIAARRATPQRLRAMLAQSAAVIDRFIDIIPDGQRAPRQPGAISHTMATVFAVITIIFYFVGQRTLRPDVISEWLQNAVPALAYVLFLLMLAGWALPFLAFVLDRSRVPVLLVLVVISFISASIGAILYKGNDHYYELFHDHGTPPRQTGALTPGDLMEKWYAQHKGDQNPVVIVTASGGGISSAVWTTKVLTGIQQRLNELGQARGIPDLGQQFSRSILLISSASGGSVGAMHYVNAFQQGNPPASEQLGAIVEATAAPSLAATAWGVTYTDILQTFFPPILKKYLGRDRGWAMEQSWARELVRINPSEASNDYRKQIPTLGLWRSEILSDTWRPAVVFASTIVENGGILLFSPVDAPANKHGTVYYSDLYADYDMDVTTAARLSSTFPYVSPIARPMYNGDPDPCANEISEKCKQLVQHSYHLADGGYHDNYGTVAAIEWLKGVVAPWAQEHDRNILIVEIRLSPAQSGLGASKDNVAWLYSVAGPLVTLYNIWSNTQVSRGKLEYDLLKEISSLKRQLQADVNTRPVVGIEHVVFEPYAFVGDQRCYEPNVIPLSWQLSAEQKTHLLNAWEQCVENNTNRIEKVLGLFLNP